MTIFKVNQGPTMAVQVGDLRGHDGAFHHHYVPGSAGYEKLTHIRLATLADEAVASQLLPHALGDTGDGAIKHTFVGPLSTSVHGSVESLHFAALSKLNRARDQEAKAGAALAESLESIPEPADWESRASRVLVAVACTVAYGAIYGTVAVGLATIIGWIAGMF